MSKLKNDDIEVKLNLKAQQAQEEIHRLTKATDALRKQNAEHRKEISRLAAAEGDYSAEIKRLNEAIAANSRAIQHNQREIQKEEDKIDLSRKSAAELKKELKRLTGELSRTSKALNPEKWKDPESKIRRCCDLLSIYYFCIGNNNLRSCYYAILSVVICFHLLHLYRQQQPDRLYKSERESCDLLSIYYFCIGNNNLLS